MEAPGHPGHPPPLSDVFFFLAYSLKIDTLEGFIVIFFTTNVSTLISVEGGKVLSRSLNDKISNIFSPLRHSR